MGNEVIAGIHPVYEALISGSRPIERLHLARDARSERIRQILDLASRRGIPVRRESRADLDRVSARASHQGIVAIAGARSYASLDEVIQSPGRLIVVLDRVQDPRNLGAILRTAESAGAGVVVTERQSAPLTDAVARASAGAVEHVQVARVGNLSAALRRMKEAGLWVVGADPSATALWTDFDYTAPVALVLGGEGRGVRRLVLEQCDAAVRLPMKGRIQSLNVAVAAGIMLYEVLRQRGDSAV